MSGTPEMINVFQFVELRAPYTPEAKSLSRSYINDDYVDLLADKPNRIIRDLHSEVSTSAIGRLVYEQIFCNDTGDPFENLGNILFATLSLLPTYQPNCPATDPDNISLSINELEQRPYIYERGKYHLLPEKLSQIEALPLFPELAFALQVMERSVVSFDLSKLTKELEAIFKVQSLREVVFENGVYSNKFKESKRVLFDTLYLLYILRRRTSVNLEYVIDGLRALHLLEALSVDNMLLVIASGSLSQQDKLLKKTLEELFPELKGWNGTDDLNGLPLVKTKEDFEAYLKAAPVVHPIFARLHLYKVPFNDLKPIGIGDLRVVKHWITAYLPGEISYIENVLQGELRDRTHRRLEKTEETFSFSTAGKEWSTKDLQTTERFELKQEVDNIVKTELGVGANANVTYTSAGAMIVANVGANFSYKRDAAEQIKTASNFARETVNKAVEQVEKNVAESRSVTKLFETEETNKHTFNNYPGTGHVTGIYRWLDKKYKAQLFNFGKRLMFQFTIPEPAAFFVESRLRAFEAGLDCPQPPSSPTYKNVSLSFTPVDITLTRFRGLQQQYDLAEFTYPQEKKWVDFIDVNTGQNLFSGSGLDSTKWNSKTHSCRLTNAKGYKVTTFKIKGRMRFWGTGESGAGEQNTVDIYLEGQRVALHVDNNFEYWIFPDQNFPVTGALAFTKDDVSLDIGFWDIADYEMSFNAELNLSDDARLDWQTQVYNKVKGFEQQKVDKENQEIQLGYNTRLSEYRVRVAELKATLVNDLIQGQSEAYNREIIQKELKKHCITLITRELDVYAADDSFATIDAMQDKVEDFSYRRFHITENFSANSTTCSFEVKSKTINYPSIELEGAKKKGRYIQFLEQAFEWQQLAYLFYPYFWSKQSDWISMMNRTDDTDANMSAFLQAGAARVVLAVTPAYEEAVLHFLFTKEPWEGGPVPVIGDPLFIPLHEELRKQQQDLYKAVPEGDPWTFILPTSLVYLENSEVTLPTFPDV